MPALQIARSSCCLLSLLIFSLPLFDFLRHSFPPCIFLQCFYSQIFLFIYYDLHFHVFIYFVFFLNFQLLTFAAGGYLCCQFNDVTVKSINADVFALLQNFSPHPAPHCRRFIHVYATELPLCILKHGAI